MKFSELPTDIQLILKSEQATLSERNTDTPYRIVLYNKEGTRYFVAVRRVKCWADNKGHCMPFGGGSEWAIRYGKMAFRRYVTPAGTTEYELTEGVKFRKSANGTDIPARVKSKAEVLEIAQKIGIFNI